MESNMPIHTLAIDNFTPTSHHTILDVRDAANYQAGHIAFAKNCPIDDTSDDQLLTMVGDSEQVFVLCGGGTKAGRACERLATLAPTINIVHLTGGTRQAQALGWELVVEN